MKRCKFTEETRLVLVRTVALLKDPNNQSVDQDDDMHLLRTQQYLLRFHEHTTDNLPPGAARDAEARVRDTDRSCTT